jgi:hypothetical protein
MRRSTWSLKPKWRTSKRSMHVNGQWTPWMYYTLLRVSECLSLRPDCVPPWNLKGVGNTGLRVSGGGDGANSDDWRESLTLCSILWGEHQTSPRGFVKWRPLVESVHVVWFSKTIWLPPDESVHVDFISVPSTGREGGNETDKTVKTWTITSGLQSCKEAW